MANTTQIIILMYSFIKRRISYSLEKSFLLFCEKLTMLLNTYFALKL